MTKLKKKKKEKNSINSVRVVFILDYYTVKRTAAYERECTCTRRRSYSSSTTHTSTGEREFLTCTQFNSSRLDSIRAASTFSLMKTLLRFSLSLSLSLCLSLSLVGHRHDAPTLCNAGRRGCNVRETDRPAPHTHAPTGVSIRGHSV